MLTTKIGSDARIGNIEYSAFVAMVIDYVEIYQPFILEFSWPDMWLASFTLHNIPDDMIVNVQTMDEMWAHFNDRREMSIVKLPNGDYSWMIWVNDDPR